MRSGHLSDLSKTEEMAAGRSTGDIPNLSDLRIVLLGNREAGKSSAGNTILGREEFDPDVRTLQCVKRQGEVAGRQVTVVDTPGWKDYDLRFDRDSPNLLKQQIVLSVTLCPPGPHAFLLVIHENVTFTEAERNATSNHLSLLGHGAWKHSLVLFIQETPAEEKGFEVKGKMLQQLVERCGNRCHVLNIKSKDNTQVTQLLEKIEEMVGRNSGHHYEINREIIQKVEEERAEEERRAEERRKKVQRLGGALLPELRIVLLGFKDAGKSSSGNTILGREEFRPGQRSAVCVKRQGEVAGRQVTVVETPGWNGHSVNSPEMVRKEILLSQRLCDQGPQCFCLVIRVDFAFTEIHKASVQKHIFLLSETVWCHTMVLFTHGDWLGDTTIEQYIESEKALQTLVEKCGNRCHVLNNQNIGDTMQVTQLLEKIENMVAMNKSSLFKMSEDLLQNLEEQAKTEKIRAEKRMMKVKKQRQDLRASLDQIHQLSLRIVLLGFKEAGKSSTGNTILGEDVFGLRSISKCEKREGEVAGRQVTVVDTPSWYWRNGTAKAPEFIKQETILSVSLCDPGPHALLLLIRIDVCFNSQYRQEVPQYLKLFSGDIWSHTMVLFTFGDWLGDTTIEQHIESEEALQSLVEKCENRYHVLNNKNRTGDQVTELLEKIEEMVAGNKNDHYEMDRKRLEEVKERREKEEQRATERLMKVERQRQHLKSLKRNSSPRSEFRVVLLGHRTTGKSSSGNTILGREEFDLKRRTAQCVKRQGEVAGRQVTVVKAPGWWNNEKLINTPELTKQEIVLSVSLCPPGPHAVLLVIDIERSFTFEERLTIQEHLELLGGIVWSHTIMLFTSGDWLGDTTIEQYIESEEHLRYLVEKCGNRYHVLNNKNRAGDQVTELLEKIEEMLAGNRNCHFEMDRKRLEEVKERRRNEEERATERLMKVEKQRLHLQSLKRNSSPQLEFRVVLLGHRYAGKSSSGNTILGREEFDLKRRTAQCVKRQGEVAGRQVTVVKAPGWWINFNLKATPELTKQEIVLSVSLCPPGPHILLLLIKVANSYTQDVIRNIQEHLEFDRVWCHTMVLFTRGDWLGDTTIEQYIESEEHLRYLVEKCGNRYHVLNNENKSDRTQITELMEKMEEIISGNGGRHHEMDRKRLEEVKERREKEEQRAEDRQMCVYRQRSAFRFSQDDAPFLQNMRVVLLGHRLSGKSSSGNTILGREEFDLKRRTPQCVKRQGEVAGRQVTVVEAPGWWKNFSLINTPELTKQEIVFSVSLCPPGPHAVLLVIRTDYTFAEVYAKSARYNLKLLGKNVWSHTIVLFTYGDWLGDTSIEQHIESEGETLQWIVEKCGNRYHVLNNKDWTDDTQVTELLEKIEQMVVRNGGAHYERPQEEEKKKKKDKKRIRWATLFRGLLKRNRADDQSRELNEAAARLDELSLQGSMKTPPDMCGDDRSGMFTVETSGYGTYPYPSPSENTLVALSEALRESVNTEWSPFEMDRRSTGGGGDKVFYPGIRGPKIIGEDSSEDTFLDQDDLDSVDNADWRRDMRGLSDIMAELDISAGEPQCTYYRPTNCCKSCEDVEDTSHWILMEPCVSMETVVPLYKHSSPPGSFECTVSGLRWVCAVEVSLQYHFSDPHVFRAELAMLQYEPIGPLMDIKVLSGELLEAHLPHFACLEGSDSSLREAVRVLRGVDSSVTLEKCELTRFHPKLLKPSFSLTEVLVKLGIPMKAHLDVLIYRTRVTPLVLLTYVVPRDASMIQAVEEDLRRTQYAKEIITHRPNIPIWINTEFSLKGSVCDAEISPPQITLKYFKPPEFFKVVIKKPEDRFDLELKSEGKSIWEAKLHRFEYGEGTHDHEITLAASRHDTLMTSISNKDRLSHFRPALVKRTSEPTLKGLLLGLEAYKPPVLSSIEVQNILQKTSVLQDQVTSLIDMVLNKGDTACGIMLSLLEKSGLLLLSRPYQENTASLTTCRKKPSHTVSGAFVWCVDEDYEMRKDFNGHVIIIILMMSVMEED
ncbi:uncharacterized protein LOC125297515 isoform X2 [Alosa alosa]|uniref:uncharacterized protein LOC125297515 isoform X2 n=1 Tax=Alosa alosa TaxID=278164 RepID=UPI0020152230|nr:uncharacterized protein LOC125297515 isoform X2 [Alosa alosa]